MSSGRTMASALLCLALFETRRLALADDTPGGLITSPQVVDIMERQLKCEVQPAGSVVVDELGSPLPVVDGRPVKCVSISGRPVTCGRDIFDPLHFRYVCSPIEPEAKAVLQHERVLACDSRPTWIGVLLCRWDSR
jgi:hypothetical protein